MEGFVGRKLREKEEGTLVDWYEPDAESKLPRDILSVGQSCFETLTADVAAVRDSLQGMHLEQAGWI
jgi:hypothetical protein